MIFADKLIALRKKAGWSQEELAQRLGVTRQSVSKWEGAQSAPDLDKVLQLSRLFDVSTDYLLKDELELPDSAPEGETPLLRRVTLEQAAQYLELQRRAAPRMAIATLLCVLSPVVLIALAALSAFSRFGITENAAAGIGLCVLLVLVACAVALFLSCAAQSKAYAFLDKEPFETEYGVAGMVRERRNGFAARYSRLNTAGVLLCILSALPLFAALCVGAEQLAALAVCVMLVLVGVGAALFVCGGTYDTAMKKLLEEGEYSRREKSRGSVSGIVSTCYWCVVTAVFMIFTFGPRGNGQPRYSWFIWAVAGVLYPALLGLLRLLRKENGNDDAK